jgi:hypothetical protein
VSCLVFMAQGCAAPIARRSLQTSDGVVLSILESGREHAVSDKLTIALVTGWSMPASIWQNQVEEFGRSYHTIAIDPRGQGASQVAADGFTAERRARDLAPSTINQCLLIGWSSAIVVAVCSYVRRRGWRGPVDSSVGETARRRAHFSEGARRDKTLMASAIFKSAAACEVAAMVDANGCRWIKVSRCPIRSRDAGKRSPTLSPSRCFTS